MTDNKNGVDAFGILPSDPALFIEEGWVRDLQTICAAAYCSTPGVTPGEREALARRAIRAADEADCCGRPVLEAWSDGEEFTSDDLRTLAAGFQPEVTWQWCYVEKWVDGSGIYERVTFDSESKACQYLADAAENVRDFNLEVSETDRIVASVEKRRTWEPGEWEPVRPEGENGGA